MTWLALGGLAVLLLLVLLRGFATASVEAVKKALAIGAAIVGLMLLGIMLFTGRGANSLVSLVLLAPIAWRAWQAQRAAATFARGGNASAGQATEVETATLAMRLDHDSGVMRGTVKRGPDAGRDLAELDLAGLLGLLADCRATDADSVPLLEAWLDRVAPDWRDAVPPRQGGSGPMSRAEALEVLGLAEGASAEAIKAAHRRLMRSAHPDQGGSDWLASRLNAARDALL